MKPVEEAYIQRCRDEEPIIHVDEITWGLGAGETTLTAQVFGSRRREQPKVEMDDDEFQERIADVAGRAPPFRLVYSQREKKGRS